MSEIKVKIVPFDSLEDGDTFWWMGGSAAQIVERVILGSEINFVNGLDMTRRETVDSYKGEDVYIRDRT